MLKEILLEWLLSHCDCGVATGHPDRLVFDDHATLDVNELASFLLDNPTTE